MYAEPWEFLVIILQIVFEFFFRDKKAVSFFPGTIKEMLITVSTQVMPFLFYPFYQVFEWRVPIKITGKEERRFDIFLFKSFKNILTSISEFMTGEYDSDLFFRSITSDNSAPAYSVASFIGGIYFFPFDCASIADSKYIRDAVPSIVGSLVL